MQRCPNRIDHSSCGPLKDACCSPDNQICDLSSGFNFNKDTDVNFADRSLNTEHRLSIFNAWLHGQGGPEEQNHHLEKVLKYAQEQYQSGHGFVV
eukprot:7374047-Karenia_brevis.AAC.1